MAAQSKRRTPRPESAEVPPQSQAEERPIPRPRPNPPRPNKRLLLVSAILLLAWFCFLGWMALFQ